MEQNKSFDFEKMPFWKKYSLSLLLKPSYYAYKGYIASMLWGWLVVPTFVNAPTLNTWQASGIIIALSAFNSGRGRGIKEEYLKEINKEFTLYAILKPFTVLIVGYLFHFIIS